MVAASIACALAAPALFLAWVALVAHQRGNLGVRNAALALLLRLVLIAAAIMGVLLALTISAGMALSFPENIRHGYPACSTCHVAPGGGGALTLYGRGVGPGFLSSWSRDGEENPGSGLVSLPDWLAVGGDTRSVAVRSAAAGHPATFERFVMQADAELAVSPVPAVTIGGAAGVYGRDHRAEYRKAYMKIAMVDGALSARVGRFQPAYGINLPDHRLPTRAGLGLGQGGEVYAFEGALVGRYGSVIATEVVGSDATLDMADGGGYAVASDSRSGAVGRASVFLGDRAELGASMMVLTSPAGDRQAAGIFLSAAANDSLYLLAEWDRRLDDAATDLGMARLGYEIVDGFHVLALGELDGPSRGGGAGLQWFPRPHLEFSAEWQRIFTPGSPAVDAALILAHHYL